MIWRLLVILRELARENLLCEAAIRGLIPAPLAWLQWVIRPRTDALSRSVGQRLARSLTALGPASIKLGQVLSTRADLLGDDLARDLASLRDKLPAFLTAEAKATLEKELGQPLGQLFSTFEATPVSAASIAQVHLAETSDGRAVAVKILRPGIEEAFERDLRLLFWLARWALRLHPDAKRFKPLEVVTLFETIVRAEMDLRLEAAAAAELAENFVDDPGYQVPSVDWDRTARRVMTLDRVSGIPMDDKAAIEAAGIEPRAVLTIAAEVFFQQVFRDGFFHGDQHPGNMMVTEEGAITVVDFGIMGRLDPITRALLADMLVATLNQDYERLAEVYGDAGFLPPEVNKGLFSQSLRAVCQPIFGKPLAQISFARLLGQLLRLAESHALPVQPDLLLLQKNMLIAEGVSRQLDPNLNIWLLARPLIEEWVAKNRGPDARLREGLRRLTGVAARLPDNLERLETLTRQVEAEGFRLAPGQVKSPWRGRVLWVVLGLLLGLAIAA